MEQPLESPVTSKFKRNAETPDQQPLSFAPCGWSLWENNHVPNSSSLLSKGHWERVKCVAGQIHRSPVGSGTQSWAQPSASDSKESGLLPDARVVNYLDPTRPLPGRPPSLLSHLFSPYSGWCVVFKEGAFFLVL